MLYVDEIRTYTTKLPYKRWCHLATDESLDELHAMAERLGLKREWFQDKPNSPHYDLVPSKRALALTYVGEVQAVSGMELVERCHPRVAEGAKRMVEGLIKMSGIEIVTQKTLF